MSKKFVFNKTKTKVTQPEVIDLLDSDDDDFVNPPPRTKDKNTSTSHCSHSQSKVESDTFLKSEYFDEKAHVVDDECVPQIRISTSIFGNENNHVTTDDDVAISTNKNSKAAWKGLMNVMQTNQTFAKSNGNVSKVKVVNKVLSHKKPFKRVLSPVKALSKTSKLSPSPRRKVLKMESSTLPSCSSPSTSSTSAKGLENVVLGDDVEASGSTKNVKIASIFLKPAERAALLTKDKVHLNDETTLLSVFGSDLNEEVSDIEEDNPENFDGNVVRLVNEGTIPQEAFNEKSNDGKVRRKCPFYKKLPGTKFTVDAFSYGLLPDCNVYFLSHFHSDHYVGLTKKFTPCTVICSRPTGNLVKMKLGLPETSIRKLRLNKVYIVDGTEVVLIDANHCPGSVMFVFRLPNGTTYLHTGDFRYTPNMLKNRFLSSIRVDCLYLDTTYLDPKYDFPMQGETILKLIGNLKLHKEIWDKTLIVCGSYLIGKERVYYSVAEALGTKVFATTDKRRILRALENKHYNEYLADEEDGADVHVLSMNNINPKFLSEYLQERPRYSTVVGIQPSGWQFSASGKGKSHKSYFNDTVIIMGIPYSEHSSFSELREFVSNIKPVKVQPTVNVGRANERDAMMQHINTWLRLALKS